MKMGSVDLMVCQGSNNNIPYCQVGRDEQMRLSVGLINSEISWIQPGQLTEQVISKVNLDQQVQLTEVKDQDDLLMIGGIGIFLPFTQEEAKISVAYGAATTEEQSQRMMTVKEDLEQTCETAQVDERKNERSEEWLNDFSQRAERAIELELTAEKEAGAEEESEHSKEWLNAFSIEAEETATWEFAIEVEEEEEYNICFVDLWQQIEDLEERVKVQGVHIQQVKLETDEEGVGDHDDLSNGQKIL